MCSKPLSSSDWRPDLSWTDVYFNHYSLLLMMHTDFEFVFFLFLFLNDEGSPRSVLYFFFFYWEIVPNIWLPVWLYWHASNTCSSTASATVITKGLKWIYLSTLSIYSSDTVDTVWSVVAGHPLWRSFRDVFLLSVPAVWLRLIRSLERTVRKVIRGECLKKWSCDPLHPLISSSGVIYWWWQYYYS